MKKLIIFILVFVTSYSFGQNCSVNADIDQTVCANATTVTLTGSATGLPQLPLVTTWSQVGGPSAVITNPNSLSTTVTGLIGGNTYTFRFSSTCTDGSLVYDDMQVIVNKITVANAGPDFDPICPNASAATRRLAANSVGSGETGAWSVVSGSGLTITTPSSPTSAFTMQNTVAGNSVLRWTITNASTGCSSFDDVIIPKIGGVSPFTAGPDQTLAACYNPPSTTATLAGSFVGNGTGGQIGTWTVVSGPNVPGITSPNANNSGLTNLREGVYIFRWTAVGSCISGSDDVQITVPAGIGAATTASAAISGNPTMPFCDGRDNVVLVGNTPKVFETGTWTQTVGPTSGVVIGSPTSPITTVTGLNGTSNYTFRYTISNPTSGCTSTKDVSISYGTPPALSITTSKPLFSTCGATTASIAYTHSGTGTVQYSIISGPATTSFPTIPSAYATAASPLVLTGLDQGGTYLVRLRKASGTGSTCETVYDEITVYMSKTPSLATAGSNQLFACSVYNGTLNANVPAAGTGTGVWSQISGPNTAVFANKYDPKTAISGMTNGKYVFRWLISNGDQCSTNQADVTVGVASTTPTQANAGEDQTVCYNSPLVLQGNAPVLNETGTWSVSPSTGINFSNINSKNAVVTGMSANTVYTFTWTITNGCGSTNDQVIITANTTVGPIASVAGPDQCLASGTTTITLAGNDPSPATGLWTQISGTAATITSPGTYNSTVTGLSDGNYQFEWAITRNACTVTRDTVSISILKPTTTANAGSDQIICGTTTTLAGNVASTGSTAGVGTWTVVSGSGGVVFSDVNSPTSTVSNLSSGVYVLRWTITNGTCSSNYDEVKLSVSTPPATAAAGNDIFICGSGTTTTMAANTPGAGQGTGYWSVISGPNTPTITSLNSATTTITGLTTGTYVFRWTIQNGPYCTPSTDDVSVQVVPPANAGADQSSCEATSANLFGNASTTGTWSQVGTVPNTATLTVTTPSTATASGLIAGTYTFRYSISTPGCTSSDDMLVIISTPTVANAGVDKDLCGVTSWTMTANTPTSGTGQWTRVSGPNTPTISSTSNPTATIGIGATPAQAGTYMYDWKITNGSCSSTDRVVIRISNIDATANAGADQPHVCGSVAYMAASVPINGTGLWSQISGPNTAVFSSTISYNSKVTGLIAGTYVFRWTISSGACTPVFDEVSITVFDNPTIPTAGSDQSLCGAVSTELAGNTIISGTGTWSKESGPSCTITNVNNPTTTVTSMLPGTYVFRWTALLGTCSLYDEVTVVINENPSTANAGADFSSCLYSPLNLAATAPTVGTGVWTQISGGAVNISTPSSPTTSIIGAVVGSYGFRWTVSNGICPSSTDDVAVTIDNITTQPNAGPDQNLSNASQFTMAGNTISSGTGTWSKISGPNIPTITTPNSPTTSITGTIPGTYTFRWTATNGSCSQYDEMIVNNASPIATNDIQQTPLNTAVSGQLMTNDKGVTSVTSATIGGNTITMATPTIVSGVDDAGNTITNAGSITINTDGTYTFTPTNGFTGTIDPITYVGTGLGGANDSAILSIEVLPKVWPGNNPPVAQNDVNSTKMNVTITGATILNNDSDPDGNTLTVSLASIGGSPITLGSSTTVSGIDLNSTVVSNAGTITLNSTGIYTFIPATGFTGTIDDITYTISDGNGGTDVAKLNINVLPYIVNTTYANDDAIAKPQGTTMTGNILTNDFDPEANTQTVTSLNVNGTSITVGSATLIPGKGTLTVTSVGAYTFVPLTNFVGTVPVIYNKCDNGIPQACDQATLYLTTLPRIIIAENDIQQTPMNTAVSGQLMTNDEGVTSISSATIGGSPFTLGVAKQVSGIDDAGNTIANAGMLTINGVGTYTFTPTSGFTGTINSVTYTGADANGTVDNAILSIEVLPKVWPGNNPPVAQNDVATTEMNIAVNSSILQNDSDPDGDVLTILSSSVTLGTPTIVSGVDYNGNIVVNAGLITLNTNGTYTFTPSNGFIGTINDISYIIQDPSGLTDAAILNINVLPNNGNTTYANDDANSAPRGSTMTGNILTNDTDPEGNTQTVSSANASGTTINIGSATTIPSVGSLTLLSNGNYTFVPLSTFVGTIPVIYSKCDNGTPSVCDEATLYLTSLPRGIIAENDIQQTPMNTAVSGQLMTNDEGVTSISSATIGGSSFTLGVAKQVSGIDDAGNTIANAGLLTINGVGTYSFTPASGFTGTINPVTYVGAGANNSTDNAILSIEVLPVVLPGNNPPVAQNDVASTEMGISVSSTVLSNDSDPDGNSLTVISSSVTIGSATTVSGLDLGGGAVANAGSITLSSTGSYIFTPSAGFTGTVNDITYTISDGNGGTDTAILSINVLPKNTNSTFANDDANSAPKGTTMTGSVLTNDTDPEGNTQEVSSANAGATSITIGTSTSIPSVGSLTLSTDGSYTFIPLANFVGTVAIIYSKCDNGSPSVCDEATLYLTSLPKGVIADNDIQQTPMNISVSGQLMTNDEGVTSISSASIGGNNIPIATPTIVAGVNDLGNAVTNAGSLTMNTDGTYSFTPTTGFTGTINPITYIGAGANGSTDNAILSIEVLPTVKITNNIPVAQNDVSSTKAGVAISSTVIANDSDPDGNALTVTVSSVNIGSASTVAGVNLGGAAVANAGSITLSSNGSYTFTPSAGFTGTINDISYTISDGHGGTDAAILSINVLPNNGNTTYANDDANSKPQGTTMTGSVLTNDFDPEGNTHTVSSATINGTGITIGSSNTINGIGSLTLNSNGTYTFIPLTPYVGTLSVIYIKCDNATPSACDEATLYLTCLPSTKSCLISNKNVTTKLIR